VSKRYQRYNSRSVKQALADIFRTGKEEGHFYALDDVTLDIYAGETVGLVGRNGSGKSTILKLIAGITTPSSGEIRVSGRVSPLLELGAGFHPDFSGRDNIMLNASVLGLSNREARERFDRIVDFAELWDFIDMPVKHYSSGMYARLGFAIATNVEPEILLIDEILSVGDAPFQEKCLRKIQEFQEENVTMVLVSHMVGIERFCDRVVHLERGRITKAEHMTSHGDQGLVRANPVAL
jgi:ABC-2 type transport system ATP-binding protein